MLTLSMDANLETNEGTVTITCAPGSLAELQGLAEELVRRSNVEQGSTLYNLNDPMNNAHPEIS